MPENYMLQMKRVFAQTGARRPKLLLHSCCGPCSSSVLETLCPHFEVTVDYYNPNIDTAEEYAHRAAEQTRFAAAAPFAGGTQVLVAPLAWYAGSWIVPLENRAQLRPLAYVAAIAVVCTAEELVLGLGRRLPIAGKLLRIVPVAALNSCVLGTVLVERTQSFTLMQSLGFGLGSGVGYLLAVLLVTEAQHRLRSKAIPSAFRGLPITLVYIGVLALAIYGFTGHSVIL